MARSSGTFQPGRSGNPAGVVRQANGQTVGAQIHGFYKRRVRRCDACQTEYVARSLTSRFCSDPCRVQHGQWSFRVASQTNRRVLGMTRE